MTSDNSNSSNVNIQPKPYVSEKIVFDFDKLGPEFYRADLELQGVDHSGPSYEGRVFINNDTANDDTPTDANNRYVGSYYIFGHGGCYGDVGHCDMRRERTRFNLIPNQLKPENISMIITPIIKDLKNNTQEFKITIVPVLSDSNPMGRDIDLENIVSIEKVILHAYDLE
jgi:hypothetical protein